MIKKAKRIISIFVILITLFCLVGWKETPSTIITIDIPRKASVDEPINCKIGIGKSYGAHYNGHIETVFTIWGNGIVFNDYKDRYCKTYDLSKEIYRCDKYNKPSQFFDLTIDFRELQNTEGTINVELMSYFKDGSTTGSGNEIHYEIKNGKVYLSLRYKQNQITIQKIITYLPQILKTIFVVWIVWMIIKVILCVGIITYRRKKNCLERH